MWRMINFLSYLDIFAVVFFLEKERERKKIFNQKKVRKLQTHAFKKEVLVLACFRRCPFAGREREGGRESLLENIFLLEIITNLATTGATFLCLLLYKVIVLPLQCHRSLQSAHNILQYQPTIAVRA